MIETNISRIIRKYLSNRFSAETEERVQRWIIRKEKSEEKKQASLDYWDSLEQYSDGQTLSALERVNKRIGYSQKQTVEISFYKRLSRIAAVLIPLFLIAGGYLYYQSTKNNLIEISVAYEEEKHLFLPDSSEIWINAGSTVRFPKEFKEDKRIVELDGEAYFSIRRNESNPFIVNTNNLSVKVLGTQFNIKAYANEERITTTLISGKVEIRANNISQILKSNEQLTFNRSTLAMEIVNVNSDEINSWISGQLVFNDSSLKEILLSLERRFDMSITNNTAIPASKLYTVKFLRNETLEEILNILQEVVGFNYVKQENNIILNKK
jgi:ferric-dicitrate binding protein FerR (iron transport regulator)